MGPSGGFHHTNGPPVLGGRTRTLNNWTRTSRVADYTTPEWVGVQISRAACGSRSPSDQEARVVSPAGPVERCSPGAPRAR